MRKLIIIPLAALGILVGLGLIAESRSGETADPTCTPRVYRTEGAHIVSEWSKGEVCE